MVCCSLVSSLDLVSTSSSSSSSSSKCFGFFRLMSRTWSSPLNVTRLPPRSAIVNIIYEQETVRSCAIRTESEFHQLHDIVAKVHPKQLGHKST
eukprot:m.25494 g.25494  ORF g.25494 m.25494 type:complete len:94 (+) comp8727_c1_seq1:892-1173(+)